MNLIAFGCSNTYGHGLHDCIKKTKKNFFAPGDTASKYAWPQVLAKWIGFTCDNLSIPGASNLEITKNVLSTEFTKRDHVFILWSYFDRHCLLDQDSIEQIGPWISNKRSINYYRSNHTEYQQAFNFWIYCNAIENLIRPKVAQLYQLLPWSEQTSWIPEWNTVDIIDIFMRDLSLNWPLAQDGMHPGVHAHREYAKALHKFLIEKENYSG